MDPRASYKEFFNKAMGWEPRNPGRGPYPYQVDLALNHVFPDLLDVPTGLGKTAAVVLAWIWRRRFHEQFRYETPRRLVYCLPMRVLAEQTESNVRDWLRRCDLLGDAGDGKISVHLLMGGADDLKTWAEYPEEDMILIGTQDMLLSRALIRGYGMSRYLWPVHFGLLHNDVQWVFDEVQLMGAGLATSAQLDAFRRSFSLELRSRSLWVSATLNPEWLATVDMKPHMDALNSVTIGHDDREQAGARLKAIKGIERTALSLGKNAASKKGRDTYLLTLCETVLSSHYERAQTLVILNRVDRAQGLFQLIRERRPEHKDLLIHARFRAAERAEQARRLRQEANVDRIIIATQAIEAGVDVSSKVLVTELAPWPSLVQRFGRCNRYGEHNADGGARIRWVNVEDDADALPYSVEELLGAREKLASLAGCSPSDLPPTDEQRPLSAVLRRKDLLELFNTDPDLSGFDVDVSDYIRDSGVPGLHVFWRDFDDPNQFQFQPAPDRRELCPISISQAKGLHKRGAWCWDSLGDAWIKLDREPRPGMTLLLRAADGGYDAEIGFDASRKNPVPVLVQKAMQGSDAFGEDWRSQQPLPVMLMDHLGHVAEQARRLCNEVGETKHCDKVIRAGRWHDVGKAHEVFDASMHGCDEAPVGLLAKSPCRGRYRRRFFRHELASMLAWLAQHGDEPDADLIAYLIVAHHGKVRMSLRAMPTENADDGIKRFARGVWEGDVLPAIDFDGERSDEITLQLALMELGESEQGPSWTARTLKLLNKYGPFRLAWLESLVRIADWRASAAEQRQRWGNRDE